MSDRRLGRLFKRGGVWWLQYYQRAMNRDERGRQVRESSRSRDRRVATKLLAQRVSEMAPGRPLAVDYERVTFADLERIVLDNYDANERKSRNRVVIAFRHLRPFFERTAAVFIAGDRLETYVSVRREEGAKPATILYELASLRRAFRLAVKAGRLPGVPSFPTITVRNARKGFFEEGAFEQVMSNLPEDVQPLVQFLWLTGWRKGEALGLQWRSVDFVTGTIRIEETKSGEPRTLPFHALPELDALLRELRGRTRALERDRGTIVPWVFHRENGHPIRDLRRAWVTATRAAGVPGRILHDFRRTAVRRMEQAGVPRSVAMKISGHKTESIYRRYAIVAERDIADGLRKVAAFQRKVARAASEGQMGDSRPPSWVPSPSQVADGMVAWDGIEPPTRGFSVRCSTS